MGRVTKPPEVRRQELLDTAMELFCRKGYEETSMGDIARAAGVAQGLCYRYFDSKQALFHQAMDQYVRACCTGFLPVIQDRSLSIAQRLNRMAAQVVETDRDSRYSGFYHRPGNEMFHAELSLRMCRFLTPIVARELRAACEAGELELRHPELTASYLLHGQIGLMEEGEIPLEELMRQVRRYAQLILNAG